MASIDPQPRSGATLDLEAIRSRWEDVVEGDSVWEWSSNLHWIIDRDLPDLLAELDRLRSDLAECYRLTGADPDGNEDWRLAPHAVSEVKRLRAEEDAAVDVICAIRDVLPAELVSPPAWDDSDLPAKVSLLRSERDLYRDAIRQHRDHDFAADPTVSKVATFREMREVNERLWAALDFGGVA